MTTFFPWTISGISLTLGILSLVCAIALLCRPLAVRRVLLAIPRNRVLGWALAAIAYGAVVWILYNAELGRFSGLKTYLLPAYLVVLGATIYFMGELLAARAIGGLLLLLANPVLNTVRWVDTPWRLLFVVLAYAWIIAGMWLVLSPWQFRNCTSRLLPEPIHFRAKLLAVILLFFAALCLLLPMCVFSRIAGIPAA